MNKRSIRVLLPAFCAVVAALASDASKAVQRPNIVMILVDDVGTGWIPPYADRLTPADVEPEVLHLYERQRNGGDALDLQKHIEAASTCMPQLSALAKDGAVFDNCFATASLCGPSRAGLLTGSFQQRWGAYANIDVYYHAIPADRATIAEPLQAAGYRTGMIGKWHVATRDTAILDQVWADRGNSGPIPEKKLRALEQDNEARYDYAYESSSASGEHPLDRGFDYYFGYNRHEDSYYESKTLWENHQRVSQRPKGELLTDLFNDKSCEFITSALEEKSPFFLYYSPMTLHGRVYPPPKHYSDAFNTGIPFSDVYAGHLLALDDGIKKIFQTLEKYGQAENTLFIFTADNGCTSYNVPPYNAPNRGGKGTAWLGGMNVPLVVWHPDLVKPCITREIVSLADLMPTVLEAAGADIPAELDGISFLPFLRGEKEKGPRESLVSCGIHASHWSYFYEGKGDHNVEDAQKCPMYAWKLKGDTLLMQITPLRPGLMKSLPNGLPARTLMYDISMDRQQREDIHGQYPKRTEAMKREISTWLGGMKPPGFGQKANYPVLLNGLEEGLTQ